MKTLAEKFETLHAAEDVARRAFADIIDPSSGEALAPGEVAFDPTSKRIFANENGKLTKKPAKGA